MNRNAMLALGLITVTALGHPRFAAAKTCTTASAGTQTVNGKTFNCTQQTCTHYVCQTLGAGRQRDCSIAVTETGPVVCTSGGSPKKNAKQTDVLTNSSGSGASTTTSKRPTNSSALTSSGILPSSAAGAIKFQQTVPPRNRTIDIKTTTSNTKTTTPDPTKR